jgi:hypothetical protein
MSRTPVDPRVYLLADHLDNILSCGEDLLATPTSVDSGGAISERRLYIETVRTLEVRIVSRVLMAREQAEGLRRIDRRFAPVVSLFQSGTLELADAAADLADSTGPDFLTGKDAIAYLRSRHVIATDRPGLDDGELPPITETFAVSGTTPLGALLDMTSTFLDALEAQFDLYEGSSPERTTTRTESTTGETVEASR